MAAGLDALPPKFRELPLPGARDTHGSVSKQLACTAAQTPQRFRRGVQVLSQCTHCAVQHAGRKLAWWPLRRHTPPGLRQAWRPASSRLEICTTSLSLGAPPAMKTARPLAGTGGMQWQFPQGTVWAVRRRQARPQVPVHPAEQVPAFWHTTPARRLEPAPLAAAWAPWPLLACTAQTPTARRRLPASPSLTVVWRHTRE